ncbi:hypothetical protein [Snuella lapsa]
MKNIITFLLLIVSSCLFCQNPINQYYSENSKLRVVYKDSSNRFHSTKKPMVFVNDVFIENESVLGTINPNEIKNIKIEKESFNKNDVEYYGKILIETKSGYEPNLITLKALSKKYIKLNTNPVVFQIDENVISENYDTYLVDENFILKIVVESVKTSDENTEIHLVKLVTRTPENIKKANEIKIRGDGI